MPNRKCKTCGKVYVGGQSISTHLRKAHKMAGHGLAEENSTETDEKVTSQLWHSSPSNRPKYLGEMEGEEKKAMYDSMEPHECLHCHEVFVSRRAVGQHMRIHKLPERAIQGKDYKAVPDKPVTRQKANQTSNTSRRGRPFGIPRKSQVPVLTAQMTHVDIPVILRIPITLGQAVVVNIAEG